MRLASIRPPVMALSATLLLASLPTNAPAQANSTSSTVTSAPALSDKEYWSIFTTMSEDGGSFPSENFVSNEMTFQYVIPTLQRTLAPNGVYLGVGPEQNFTYIANLKPQLAIIFDIRRQNAMQHLLYKALFEQSATRAEFVARLFSRPAVAALGVNATAAALFSAVQSALPNDSIYQANRKAVVQLLTGKHGFALSAVDVNTINYLYEVFFRAGPDINYAYRPGTMSFLPPRYPTYGMLQSATSADSVPLAFLGTEANYRAVRDMHVRNAIVPVVADFAGPTGIRAVGEFLRKRKLSVTAFYLSNVEQYLFRSQLGPQQFYGNVASLPLDSSATFIRSVPPGYDNAPFSATGNASTLAGTMRMFVTDSAGVRIVRTTVDSAGVLVTKETRDSARGPAIPGMTLQGVTFPNYNNILISGIASVRVTLDDFLAGKVVNYRDLVTMTKVNGWK